MTYHQVVATTGTSIFAPQNVFSGWIDQHARDVVVRQGTKLRPASEGALDTLRVRWTSETPPVPSDKRTSVSAEYSTLHALRVREQLADEPSVVLVHTDTFDGELAAVLVKRLLERDFGAWVTLKKVADLNVDRPTELQRSLGAFMHEVAAALRAGQPMTTCFAPLRGYKVMTSLAYLAGAFLQYPTLYLHESGQVLHKVPWVPIRIDEDELAHVALVVRRAVQGVTWGALDAAERGLVEDHPWLFERSGVGNEDLVELNAFGRFLRDEPRYRRVIGTRIRGTTDVAKACRTADQRKFVADEVVELRRLLDEPLRHQGVLHHEVDFGHRGTPWSLFRGASGRAGVFRAAYRWQPEELPFLGSAERYAAFSA